MVEEEEEETVLMLNFLQLFDSERNRDVWVHPINQERNLTGFITELRLDPAKLYNLYDNVNF
jgi:hypothetical protein